MKCSVCNIRIQQKNKEKTKEAINCYYSFIIRARDVMFVTFSFDPQVIITNFIIKRQIFSILLWKIAKLISGPRDEASALSNWNEPKSTVSNQVWAKTNKPFPHHYSRFLLEMPSSRVIFLMHFKNTIRYMYTDLKRACFLFVIYANCGSWFRLWQKVLGN